MPDDPEIEAIRSRFQRDEKVVEIVDFGAGSRISGKAMRTVRSIAHGGISPSKYSKLFTQFIRYFNCKNVVELGTALGINALYLARATPEVRVTSFEGCNTIADIAEQVIAQCGCANIQIIRGNVDDTLPSFLRNTRDIDLLYMDANHTYEATLAYMDQVISRLSFRAVLIIGDIYWSKEMTRVWKDMKKRFPRAVCIDIYQCGIIIFDKNMPAADLRFAY